MLIVGWNCSHCGRIFSPMVPECVYCNNDSHQIEEEEVLEPAVGFIQTDELDVDEDDMLEETEDGLLHRQKGKRRTRM